MLKLYPVKLGTFLRHSVVRVSCCYDSATSTLRSIKLCSGHEKLFLTVFNLVIIDTEYGI